MPDAPTLEDPQNTQEPDRLAGDPVGSGEEAADASGSGRLPPPVLAMGIIIVALLAVLIIVQFRGPRDEPTPVPDTELYKLRAELEAGRAEVNRQLIELGLPPRGGDSESVDEIAGRLRNDTDALIAITKRFQEMLVERDSSSGTTSAELLRSEQTRKSLVEEVSRLRQQLDITERSGADSDSLRRQIDQMRAEQDRMRAERDQVTAALAAANDRLAAVAHAPNPDDYADLQRRFTETLNAKKFYEARLAELNPLFEGLVED